jgi:hypothetical protein
MRLARRLERADLAAVIRTVVGVIPPLGVVSASSRNTTSSADCQRSSRRFSRHPMIRSASGAGSPSRRCEMGSSWSSTCDASTACWLSPVIGGSPTSIS